MTSQLAYEVLMILAAGLAAGLVCKRLHTPTLIGYMLIGTVIGSGGFGLLPERTVEVDYLAEVGVFLLLFSIGLEFTLDELIRLGRHLLVGGGVQMLLVAVPVTLVLIGLGLAWQAALIVGGAAAFSSTVLVFKTLAEWGQTSSPAGRRAIGILLFQDAALVPLLMAVPLLTRNAASMAVGDYFRLLAASAGFVAAVIWLRGLLKTKVVPALAGYRSLELVILATLVLLVSVTLAAHRLGLPPAVGAFAAGLMLSGNRWTKQIDALVLPFRETFAAVFFVGLGLKLDPSVLTHQPLAAAGGLLALVVLKALAATVALRLTQLPWRPSFGMGIGLAHIGEFAFALVAIALAAGLLSAAEVQLFIAVGLASLILSPLLLSLGIRFAREDMSETAAAVVEVEEPSPAGRKALVIGIGPVGGRIASLLETAGRDVCLVDRNPLNLHAFAQAGFRCVSGEATETEILQRADADLANEVVVCVPHDEDALEITRVVRHLNPACRLVVRCRYQGNVPELKKAGADCVVSEEREAVSALEKAVFGDSPGKIP
jgi:CPA2 family monovalent cation:H+ antiporter-2